MFKEYKRFIPLLVSYFSENKDKGGVLKPGPTGKGFKKISRALKNVSSGASSFKNKTVRKDPKRLSYFALDDGYVHKINDEQIDGKYINKIYTDGYNSKYLGKSEVRNGTRKQKFRKPPTSSLIKYVLNKEIFDEFEVDVNKCVIVDGCFETNKQTLKSQLIPASPEGVFTRYPTVKNLELFDDTVKTIFRKLKNIGIIDVQTFDDVYLTEISPNKKPGFRYEEEFRQTTKTEALPTALKLARKRWDYASKSTVKIIDRNKIKPGVYTIGARNKRDYTYENMEAASSRVVHMPELHCELTSAPWCDAFIDRLKELAKGPIYLGNSILDWFRLNKDSYDSAFILEGDWKKFDSTLYIKIITTALAVLRCFYPHNNKYIDKHFILMYDTLSIKDYYTVGGNVFRAFHGLPSGVKSTSILGSIINLISLVFCIGPSQSRMFNFIVGGDDFLVCCKNNSIDPDDLCEQMEHNSEVLGMKFKFLKIKQFNAENVEDCPVFYKYTIYKGFPVVPTSSVLERVFMPWNKSYNTSLSVKKFLYDVMPSLGKPMSHLLLYYDYLSSSLYFLFLG
jgi:hypothetical protein